LVPVIPGFPSPGGRRAPVPPSPLQGEIVRPRVLESLAARFDQPVTVVVAGAGFGKTTALAQAIRANSAAPRGIDAWVACEPGDEDAGRLSRAILAALGVPPDSGGNLDHVLRALAAAAPLDVCIFIDDLHELPPNSAGETFVSELVTRLPPHAHLVLASRDRMAIPLARRRAAGQVVDVGSELLAFTETEIAALAEQLGEDKDGCGGLGGWPSLVRLVLSAPPGATRQFLWEEIVAGLSPGERSGLLALAVLRAGTAAEVSEVAGRDVDLDDLVHSVPLVYADEQGRLGAHQLWEDAVERIFPAAEVHEARRRTLDVLVQRGETIRMGAAAVRWGDPVMFRTACVALVRENLGALPVDTAARWLAGTPPDAVGTPEHRLLELAVRHGENRPAAELDAALDALETTFVEVGDAESRAVTLAMGAVAAHARNDMGRLVALTQRVRALPGPTQSPLLQFFVGTFDAAHTALAGDVDGALRRIEAMPSQGVPPTVRELLVRLHVIMLVLAGRAEEAVPIGSTLLQSANVYVQSIPSMLRWAAGDPAEYLAAAPHAPEPSPGANHPYRFFRAAHGTVVASALGERVLADTWRAEMEASIGDPTDSRDGALAVNALASCRILDHDDEAATDLIADHLARHPLGDARGEAHLRHNLAIAYVTSDEARDHWDAATLGPSHARTRAVARQLLDARSGGLERSSGLESPAVVLTSLPLAWTVELAVRAIAAGCPDGAGLLRQVATWLPSPTRRELDWLATHGDRTCRAVAAGLGEDLPDATQPPLTVDVLGPLRLRVGDVEIDSRELRRARVRTLLALLVLRGPLRRERICDLLWPDLAPQAAAQNLRVTLTHLRRLLESDEGSTRSTWRIRSSRDSVELAGPPLVETDLRRFEGDVAAADRSEQLGDSAAVIANLTSAVELWRGDPLVDLASLDELGGDIEYVSRSLVDSCQRLGELLLVAGRFDEALRCAERSRVAAPYSERAHRLAIACHLQRRDRAGLESALRSTRASLDELGVEPEAATSILVRRASVLLGPPRTERIDST
jgi:LuxR family transcriptional regulator, maltose regulon positive regulatory protein